MPRNRILRLFFEPFFQDTGGLCELAQRAVRHRQQLAGFAMLWPERDHSAVTRRSYFGTLQAVEQNAQVDIGVDVFRVQANGCAVRSFRFDRLPVARNSTPRLLWALASRVDSDRMPVRIDSGIQSAIRLQDYPVPVRLIWA